MGKSTCSSYRYSGTGCVYFLVCPACGRAYEISREDGRRLEHQPDFALPPDGLIPSGNRVPSRPGSARGLRKRDRPRGTGSAASAADRSDFLYRQSRLFRAAFALSGSRCLPFFFPGRISLILHLQPVCPAAELGGVIGPGSKEHPGQSP